MMENCKGGFIPLPRFSNYEKFARISASAFKMYVYLKEFECRYTGGTKSEFFCSAEQLGAVSGLSKSTIQRGRKELVDEGIIETWLAPDLV